MMLPRLDVPPVAQLAKSNGVYGIWQGHEATAAQVDVEILKAIAAWAHDKRASPALLHVLIVDIGFYGSSDECSLASFRTYNRRLLQSRIVDHNVMRFEYE